MGFITSQHCMPRPAAGKSLCDIMLHELLAAYSFGAGHPTYKRVIFLAGASQMFDFALEHAATGRRLHMLCQFRSMALLVDVQHDPTVQFWILQAVAV